MTPLVSIITPTHGREAFLGETRRWVASQTYANIEWLVLDDSPQPSRLLEGCPDARLRYVHVAEPLTIGDKRNRLVAAARGDYVAHFDDDDYYAAHYIETMVANLGASAADFVNLCSWYLYDLRHDFFGFWALRQTTGLHYRCYVDGLKLANFTPENNAALATNYLGYGFTYVYRRAVWEAAPFAARNWGEDTDFVNAAQRRFQLLSIEDRSSLVLHVLHRGSTSSCFPQYHLPTFLLPVLFSAPSAFRGALRDGRGAAAPAAGARAPTDSATG